MNPDRDSLDVEFNAALAALAAGGVVALVDEHNDCGDLLTAAGSITAAGVNFLAKHGRGLTSLALSAGRVEALGLLPMAASWEPLRKPFTVSIEAAHGVGSGISAADRAVTIQVAVAPDTRPGDLVTPGHVFPLRAHHDGLNAAASRVEAALALAALAGQGEGAVLSEILDDAGELASLATIATLVDRLHLPWISLHGLAARAGRIDLAYAPKEVSDVPDRRRFRQPVLSVPFTRPG